MSALGWRGLERGAARRVAAAGRWRLHRPRQLRPGRSATPGIALEPALDARRGVVRRARPATARPAAGPASLPPGLAEALDERGWTSSPTRPRHDRGARPCPARGDRNDRARASARRGAGRRPGWPATARTAARSRRPRGQVLTNHPAAIFASFRDGDACRGDRHARRSTTAGPGCSRSRSRPSTAGVGLGALVSAAALRWAGQRGARRTYLQASVDNAAARRALRRPRATPSTTTTSTATRTCGRRAQRSSCHSDQPSMTVKPSRSFTATM